MLHISNIAQCDRCRERSLAVCEVSYKKDKTMACMACRKDRKPCDKSIRSIASSTLHPGARDTVVGAAVDKKRARGKRSHRAAPAVTTEDATRPLQASSFPSELTDIQAYLRDLDKQENQHVEFIQENHARIIELQAVVAAKASHLAEIKTCITKARAALYTETASSTQPTNLTLPCRSTKRPACDE